MHMTFQSVDLRAFPYRVRCVGPRDWQAERWGFGAWEDGEPYLVIAEHLPSAYAAQMACERDEQREQAELAASPMDVSF